MIYSFICKESSRLGVININGIDVLERDLEDYLWALKSKRLKEIMEICSDCRELGPEIHYQALESEKAQDSVINEITNFMYNDSDVLVLDIEEEEKDLLNKKYFLKIFN